MINSEQIKTNVGFALKALRIGKGLTQEELAERVDLQPNTIAKIETGKIYLTSKTLAILCNFFKVSPAFFYMPKIHLNIEENLNFIQEIATLLPSCNTKTLNMIRNVVIVLQSGQ